MRRNTQPILRLHRTARSCAITALALALLAETLGGIAARAQTPPPPWPYRFVLNGPSTAKPGDPVTYRLDYELLDQTSSQPLAFPLEWTDHAVSLVSAQVVDGPAGTQSREKPNRLQWDFAQPVASGALEVNLQVHPDFTGSLDAGIYVRGTQIVLPKGSRDYTTTETSAPAIAAPLDGTGEAQRAMPAAALALLLGLGGATAVALGAALRARLRR